MKKKKIKKQNIFNFISILLVSILFVYYLGRFIYYKIESAKEITYSSVLSQRIIQQNNSFSLTKYLTEIDGINYFTKNSNNNYVKYKGFIWRIIKINEDNTVTLIMEESITNMAHSSIINWLNKSNTKLSGIFENMLNGTNLLINTKTCNDTFESIDSITCNKKTDYKISILSINDYINTGADESFINNGTNFWVSNNYKDDEYIYINNEGTISNDSVNNKHGVRPTITLHENTSIIDGNGTIDDPYYIEEENINTLSDVNSGAYIQFNDYLWKVVSKTGDRIKVVSTECLKDNSNKCLTMAFAQNSNQINNEDEENLITYLNTTYYETIKNKEYITTGPFYIGEYSLNDNDYTKCLSKSIYLKIGLLSVAEPFIFDVENTFLMTTSPDNNLSIFTINEEKKLYENVINKELSIRPSLYLKGDISIKNGKGTYIEPYILGE